MTFSRFRSLSVIVLLAALTHCGRTSVPSTPTKTSSAKVDGGRTAETLFDFRSNTWVNLHHVLYRHGMKKLGNNRDKHPDGLDTVDLALLAADERSAWDTAVAYYAANISNRDVVMDDELIGINQALSDCGAPSSLEGMAIPAELARALERTMPIYRARWWADHDRKNRAWIAIVKPEVEKHGVALAVELARLFHDEWPDEALRVDVTAYAPPPGAAYTTFGPPHLTIAGNDPRNQPPTALEILFHECSHLVIRATRDAIARELAAQNKKEPSLWHALLFFTSGHAVGKQIPDYQTYADREGLYDDRWAAYRRAMETHWVPYLEGRTSFDLAIRALVAAL
jgi:hypothetical protein